MFNKRKLRVRGPLHGWPNTTIIKSKDGGLAGFRIKAKYLTPNGARWTNFLTVIVVFLGSVDMLILSLRVGSLDFLVAAAAGLGGIGLISFGFFRWVLQKTALIEIYPDLIRVAGKFFFRNYDLSSPAQFNMEQHERARQEAEQYARSERGFKLYYVDSFHVFMALPGYTVELATIYNKRKAAAFVARLQVVQEVLKQAARGPQQDMEGMGPGRPRPDPG